LPCRFGAWRIAVHVLVLNIGLCGTHYKEKKGKKKKKKKREKKGRKKRKKERSCENSLVGDISLPKRVKKKSFFF
jgi:hypothetical protein